jgi:hypothetical protein
LVPPAGLKVRHAALGTEFGVELAEEPQDDVWFPALPLGNLVEHRGNFTASRTQTS